MIRVIGLCGDIGVGKSEVARILHEEHGFARVKMTDPINAMLEGLGLSDHELNGPNRDRPHPLLCGKSIRYAQQTLGVEWGRDLIDPDLWTHHWRADCRDVLTQGGRVVCENIRFPDELQMLHEVGGSLWKVTRHGVSSEGDKHASEQHREFRQYADKTITNDGSVKALSVTVAHALAHPE